MSRHYYKATDGVLTVFRATTRVFTSARFTTEAPPGGLPHPYMFSPCGGIGFSSKLVSPGKYVVVEITEAEFDVLQAAKVERIKALGGDPSTIRPTRIVGSAMSFEHPTSSGVVRLTKVGSGWVVRFVGKRRGRWRSPDAAAHAVASHQTGIPEWDERHELVSHDIIDWRPLDESI